MGFVGSIYFDTIIPIMRHVTITEKGKMKKIDVPTVGAWHVVIREVLPRLQPGLLIGLSGELGAGKTTFVQALTKKLGVKRVPPSPTFALMRSYEFPRYASIERLVHVDAYRFTSPKEAIVLDLADELADKKTIVVVEWPENMGKTIHYDLLISIRL